MSKYERLINSIISYNNESAQFSLEKRVLSLVGNKTIHFYFIMFANDWTWLYFDLVKGYLGEKSQQY